MKKKKNRSFFEGKSRGRELVNTRISHKSIDQRHPWNGGEKKKEKKKGVIEARSSAGVSVSIVRGYFRRPWLSSSKEVTRDAQRVTCRDENKLFFQSGSPRDNVAASCALGCSGSCSVGRSISGRVNIDSQPVVPLVVIHERGEDESGERTGGRSKNDIDTRGSNEIPVRMTLDGGGIIESNVWEVGRMEGDTVFRI